MLRATVQHQVSCNLVILEGRLCGPWVEEVRGVLAGLWSDPKRLCIKISLTSLSGMDSAGRDLLIDAYTRGAELIGSGLVARAFIEEAALAVAERTPQ